jgi:hypothetical protein
MTSRVTPDHQSGAEAIHAFGDEIFPDRTGQWLIGYHQADDGQEERVPKDTSQIEEETGCFLNWVIKS